jgi:hypothetical protein
MASSLKDLDDIDDFKEWRLETAGAELHSFLQRCIGLYESPGRGFSQPTTFSESHARIFSLLTGAVLDILRTNRPAKGIRMLQSECSDDASVTLTLSVAAFDDGGSAGFSLLTRASQFCEVRRHEDLIRIVARVTGRSLRGAFDDGLTENPTG